MAVNAVGYFVPVLGARRLPAAGLGQLATVLAIGAIASVPGFGLQTALAVRWARDGSVRRAGRAALGTAAITCCALALAAPAMGALLHLPTVLILLLVASTGAVVLAGRWLGELQGHQHFAALALGLVLQTCGRYGGVIIGLSLHAGVGESLAWGAAVGWLMLPLLAFLARRSRHVGSTASAAPGTSSGPDPGLGRAIGAASSATAAMFAVSYGDLILASHFLPSAQAGAYAVGAVLTKGALWAPQVVTVLALPRLARGSRRAMAAALAVVAGCGIVLVLAALFAGRTALALVGGGGYTALSGYAAGFGAVGALYAVVFVLVNAEIAAGVRWPAAALWVALAGMAAAAALIGVDSLGAMLRLSVITAASTTAVMVALDLRRRPVQISG
jgi:O-antigen/teichoic acid export membrane protein